MCSVCNGHPGTSHMTPPDTFKAATLRSLAYLDTVLPAGSSVMLIPLVDGRVLWETTHAQIHPIGVGYPAYVSPLCSRVLVVAADIRLALCIRRIYDYLNCLGMTPCAGWMTSNETMRNITSDWAATLNTQLAAVQKEAAYKHFNVYYSSWDFQTSINQYVAAGGVQMDLIEPVGESTAPDSASFFHISHIIVMLRVLA